MSFHLIWTLTLFVLFVGIVIWAWSGRRKQSFSEAAQLPLESERDGLVPPSGSKKDG